MENCSCEDRKNNGKVIIHGREYLTVAFRLSEFRKKYPLESGWRIQTECLGRDGQAVFFKAAILDPQGQIIATGHAEEHREKSQINRTSAAENAETSAIGRALASAGFVGSEFASADEIVQAMQKQKNAPPRDYHTEKFPLPDISTENWERAIVPPSLLPARERYRRVSWHDLATKDEILLETTKGEKYKAPAWLHALETLQKDSAQVVSIVRAALALREARKCQSETEKTE